MRTTLTRALVGRRLLVELVHHDRQDSQSTQNGYRSPADCPERGGDQSNQ